MRNAVLRMLESWTYRPVDVVSFWISMFWAGSLIADPTPTAQIHIVMDSLVPLWAWGLAAMSVAACHFVSIHIHSIYLPRYWALLYGGGFWVAVAIIFWGSGASLTGKGVYLSIAIMCLWHARVNYHAR